MCYFSKSLNFVSTNNSRLKGSLCSDLCYLSLYYPGTCEMVKHLCIINSPPASNVNINPKTGTMLYNYAVRSVSEVWDGGVYS